MPASPVTAAELARARGIDPKRFRQALRDRNFPWHRHNEPWRATSDSDEHREMLPVLDSLMLDSIAASRSASR